MPYQLDNLTELSGRRDGVLVLDKPAGVSSAGYLNRLKRLLPRGTKLGHAGTLDPFATGVLLALVGKATKSCEKLMGQRKVYVCKVKLGVTTPTLDPDSPEQLPEVSASIPHPDLQAVQQAITELAGGSSSDETGREVMQIPPAYSALKVGGRRAYDLARSGKPPELHARPVRVYGARLLHYAYPELEAELEVGRGYYVRSFARDLAAHFGTLGYLTALRRTRVGPYAAETALRIEHLTPDNVFLHVQDVLTA